MTVRDSAGRRLEAARDARAAAERDHDRVGVERRAQDLAHLGLVAGPHDDVGDPAEVAAALAHEVAQALAAGVDHAVEGVVGDVRVADRALERGAQVVGELRLGHVEVVEGDGALGGLRHVDPEVLLDEGREGRHVVVGERDALVAPAPPLHGGRGRRRVATAVMGSTLPAACDSGGRTGRPRTTKAAS